MNFNMNILRKRFFFLEEKLNLQIMKHKNQKPIKPKESKTYKVKSLATNQTRIVK